MIEMIRFFYYGEFYISFKKSTNDDFQMGLEVEVI